MKAYVLSLRNGLVRIGNTVFDVPEGKSEMRPIDRMPRYKKTVPGTVAVVNVKGKSFTWAGKALESIQDRFQAWNGHIENEGR